MGGTSRSSGATITYSVQDLLEKQADETRAGFKSLGESQARLEGILQHVATKEDVAAVAARVTILESSELREGGARALRDRLVSAGGYILAFIIVPVLLWAGGFLHTAPAK